MKRELEYELEIPFDLALVPQNVFVFCHVAVDDIDPLFKCNQSRGFHMLEAIVKACASSGLVSLKSRFVGKEKNVPSAIRTLYSQWKLDPSVRERNRAIYALMEENKFPNHLYVLRDYVQRYHQGELLKQSDSDDVGPLNHIDVLESEREVDRFPIREAVEEPPFNFRTDAIATPLRFKDKVQPVMESLVALNVNGEEVQVTILDRRLVHGGAEYKVEDRGWLPACDLSTDCIRAFETEAAAQIVDAKRVRDELWVKIRWRETLECKASVMKFDSVFNGLALLEQWASQAKMPYNLKKAIDMQRMARSNFSISPANRLEYLDFEEEAVDNESLCLTALSELEQASKLSMLKNPARHMMIAISLYCGEHESRVVSEQQLWDHFTIVNMVHCPDRENKFRFTQAVEECCVHKLLDKCNKDEMFSVLLGKSVAVAASTHCTGGPLRELTQLATQYEFN
jgi:hypothetical protein